jgi:phage protein D
MGLGITITTNNQANAELTEMVSSVEVTEKMDQPTQYKINFMIDICDKDIAKSLEPFTDPHVNLGVLVEVNDALICLVNGPVTKHEVNIQHGGAGSSLHVEGTDTSQEMNVRPSHHAEIGTDADIVRGILTSRTSLNTDITETPHEAHSNTDHTSVQRITDLSYIKKLAQRNGFHFWITYNEEGAGTAHFKPRSLDGDPVNELVVNLENNNIDNLRINFDINRPTRVESRQIDLRTKRIMEDSVGLDDEPTLGANSLTTFAGSQANAMTLSPTVDDGGSLRRRAEAALREAQWFITATCQTSLRKLCGKIVRLHTVVMVQGAGTRHSGKYYVTGVKHTIDAANHKMDIELARNALGNEGGSNGGLLSKIF